MKEGGVAGHLRSAVALATVLALIGVAVGVALTIGERDETAAALVTSSPSTTPMVEPSSEPIPSPTSTPAPTPSDEDTATDEGLPPDAIVLPTHGTNQVSDVLMPNMGIAGDAQLGCVWLVYTEGPAKGDRLTPLWWPGTWARFDPLRIYNHHGVEVWREGQVRDISGGGSSVHAERVPPECHSGDGSGAWWMHPLMPQGSVWLRTHQGGDVPDDLREDAEIVGESASPCVWLVDEAGRRTAVLWPREQPPADYWMRREPVRIYRNGDEIWREGQLRDIRGGLSSEGVDKLRPECRTGDVVWLMREVMPD